MTEMKKSFQVKILYVKFPSLLAIENYVNPKLHQGLFCCGISLQIYHVIIKGVPCLKKHNQGGLFTLSQVLMIIDIAYFDMALAKSSEFLDFFRIAFPSVSTPNVSLREQCIVLRMKRHSWGISSSTWKHKYYMLLFLALSHFHDHPATALRFPWVL